jgi:tetratricopeptide (TPR) repeat protein
MDCRKSLFLALSLLAGTGGCGSFLPTRVAKTETPPPSEDKLYRPATYVAFADYRASASFTKGMDPAVQDQYRDDARRSYLKAIDVDPRYMPAYLGLARLQEGCEDHAGAAATYEKAGQLAPQDASLCYQQGLCYCRAKNWSAAVQTLRKACEMDPFNRQYSTTLGFTLARAGQYNDSFIVLSRQFGEATAHSDLARMLQHLNRPDLARQQAMLALTKDPSQQAARTLLASLDKGAAATVRRPAPPAERKNEIQIVAYTEPGAAPLSAEQPVAPERTIRVPPLPVIAVHAKME